MGDVTVGAVPSPVAPAAAVTAPSASATKAAKLASVTAGLTELAKAEKASPPAETSTPPVIMPEPPASPPPALSEVAPVADDPVDPKTSKGLAAIEKQAKKFRDEQSRARAELEVERAEIARLRAEATGKVSSIDELKKLKPLELLEKLGIESEDDYDVLARAAYARTKKGKEDPRLKESAAQSAEARDLKATIADLQKKIDDLGGEFSKRDKQAQTQAFVEKYLDEAVAAIPTTPTLIGKLHAKAPEKARQALLSLGQYLEKQNDGETPTHAEVVEAYEKWRRAELEEQGVDVDAMLKPTTAAHAPRAPGKTLDVTATTGTRPINGNPSRAEKLAAVTAGLRKLEAENG